MSILAWLVAIILVIPIVAFIIFIIMALNGLYNKEQPHNVGKSYKK
jgi:hypothetical protein